MAAAEEYVSDLPTESNMMLVVAKIDLSICILSRPTKGTKTAAPLLLSLQPITFFGDR